MYELRVVRKFDAAHYLNDYEGPCANLHGHTWKVEVHFRIKGLRPNGIAEDFKTLKPMVDAVLPDHACINEQYPKLSKVTAEILAVLFLLKLREQFEEISERVAVQSVQLWETENNSVYVDVMTLDGEEHKGVVEYVRKQM